MEKAAETVKAYYDENAQREWERLERHPFEMPLTLYMMEKYIKPGDRVLDIGGGPGRYAIHFAQIGCEVTLIDLSDGNIALAREKAAEMGVSFRSYAANCLELDALDLGQYDHVLLMGPLYHLIGDEEQNRTVKQALDHLKMGGKLYVSFIMDFAGILYDLKYSGSVLQDVMRCPETAALVDNVRDGVDYTGPSFTASRFTHPRNILPFMEQFPLRKLHLFGQEGILAVQEPDLMNRSQEEIDCWIAVAKKLLEVPELLSYSEHAMYIGQKIK